MSESHSPEEPSTSAEQTGAPQPFPPHTRTAVNRRINGLYRLLSLFVICYLRYFPVERGKWRIMQAAKRFLIVEIWPGIHIRASDRSNSIEDRIILRGVQEPETVGLFARVLRAGMNVFDVGANIGQYALIAAASVGPAAEVHAFEPTRKVAKCLQQNATLNGFSNITVRQMAVTDRSGSITLYMTEGDPDVNSVVSSESSDSKVEVPATSLDDYMREANVKRVDVLKMDIEGAEILALKGARRLLEQTNAPLIFLEANPKALESGGGSLEALEAELNKYHYAFYPIATYGTVDPFTNGVAARPEHFERFPELRELLNETGAEIKGPSTADPPAP